MVEVMLDLLKIESFGRAEAERDFSEDYFLPSSFYDKVRRRERPIVIGRKGSGKTTIREALLDETVRKPELFVTHHSLSSYPWGAHEAVASSDAEPKGRHLAGWTFVILIELAKLAVGEDQTDRTGHDLQVAQALRRFITDTWGALDFDPKETFKRERYTLGGSLKPTIAGISAGTIDLKTVAREELRDRLGRMNEWLKEGLPYVLRHDAEYFVVFDGLDLDFSPTNVALTDSLVGLLRAAEDVHYWLHTLEAQGTVVILVRDDIFETIDYADRNKLLVDSAVRIRWRSAPSGPDSLRTLIEKRIATHAREQGVDPTADPWTLAFEGTVREGKDTYSYVVERTFDRPRDVIAYVNYALAAAKARLAGEAEGVDRIRWHDVLEAESEYSAYFREELRDEMSPHHAEWDEWLELLRDVGRDSFEPDAFHKVADQTETSPEKALEALYNFSVIGQRKLSRPDMVYYKYKIPSVRFDRRAVCYDVHPGFHQVLNLFEGL
jgi:hypothetical protein